MFRFDRRLGVRFVAGADEAGRGCLAGPLVAAAVLFDYERLSLSDLRALSALNDSKQHNAEMREELYPRVFRIATRVAVTSRCVRAARMLRMRFWSLVTKCGWAFTLEEPYSGCVSISRRILLRCSIASGA